MKYTLLSGSATIANAKKNTQISSFCKLFMLVVLFLSFTISSYAANTWYWVGGASTSGLPAAWTTTSNWNTTSGGGGTAGFPASGDAIVFDSKSINPTTPTAGFIYLNVSGLTISVTTLTMSSSVPIIVTLNNAPTSFTITGTITTSNSNIFNDGGNQIVYSGGAINGSASGAGGYIFGTGRIKTTANVNTTNATKIGNVLVTAANLADYSNNSLTILGDVAISSAGNLYDQGGLTVGIGGNLINLKSTSLNHTTTGKYAMTGTASSVVAAFLVNGGSGYTNGTQSLTFNTPSGGTAASGTVTVAGGIITAVSITNAGSGYTSLPTTTPTISGAGGSGAIIYPVCLIGSGLVGVNVTNGGSSYVNGSTVTFSAPTSGITATGTITVTGGAITGVTITDPGTGYTTPPTIISIGGGGSGAVLAPVITTTANNKYIVSQGGNLQFTSMTINPNVNITFSSNSTTARTLTYTGTGSTGGGLILSAGSTFNMGINQLVQGASAVLNNSGTLSTASTNATPITAGQTLTGTLVFNGTSAQTIPSGNYSSLTLNNSAGLSLGGAVTLNSTSINTSAITNVGSAVLTFTATTGVSAGMLVSGTNVPVGATVVSTAATTVTISSNVTGSAVATSTSITFSPALTFTSGVLSLGTNNLTLAANTLLSGSLGNSSYIDASGTGTLTRNGVAALASPVFPIGVGGTYNPLTITPAAGSTTTNITVGLKTGIPASVGLANNIVNQYWAVNSATAISSATIQFQFNSYGQNLTPTSSYGTGFSPNTNCELGVYGGSSYAVTSFGGKPSPTTSTTPPYTISLAALAIPAVGTTNQYLIANTGAIAISATVWTGATSTDWSDATNWSSGVPSSTLSATIPASASWTNPSNIPTLTAASSVQTLTLSSSTSSIATGGNVLSIYGGLANPGNITGSGSISFVGSGAQTISGSGGTISNLTISNSFGVTISSGGQTVSGALNLTLGTFTLTGTLTVNGSVVRSGGTFSGTPAYGNNVAVSYTGLASVAAGSEVTPSSGSFSFTLNASTFTYTLAAATPRVAGIIITAGTFTDNGFTITNSGDINNSDVFTSTGTLILTGSNQAINGVSSLTNLTLSGSGTTTTDRNITVTSGLTLTSGTLDNSTHTLTVSTSATVTRVNGTLSAQPIYGVAVNVTYTGGTANSSYELNPSSGGIGNFIMNSSGNTYTLTNGFTASGSLSFTSGTVNDGGYEIVCSGQGISGPGTHTGNGRLRLTYQNVSSAYIKLTNAVLGNVYVNSNTSLNDWSGTATINGDLVIKSNIANTLYDQAGQAYIIGGNLISITGLANTFSHTANGWFAMSGTATSSGLVGISVTAGGSGYQVGNTVTFASPSSGLTATGTVSAVNGSGAITAVNITDPGTSYTVAPTSVSFAIGSGSAVGSGATLTGVIAASANNKYIVSQGNNLSLASIIINSNVNVTFSTNGTTAKSFSVTGTSGTNFGLTIYSGARLDMGINTLATSSGTLSNSGTLQTASTATTPIPAGLTVTGTVVYNGSSAQKVVAGTYTNLTLNNTTSPSSSALSLGGAASVSGVLTLNNGTLVLGAYDFTLGSSASIAGSSVLTSSTPTSYIDVNTSTVGRFAWTLTASPPSSLTLPVGYSSTYAPLVLTSITGGATTIYAQVGSGVPVSVFDATKIVNQKWSLTASNAVNAIVKFQFNTYQSAFDPSVNCDLGTYNGGADYNAPTAFGTTVSPTTTSTPPYTITSASSLSIPTSTNVFVVGNTTAVVNTGTTTWTGTTNTDWFTSTNWDNGVPTAAKLATIPSAGITNFPVISGGTAYTNDFVIMSGATVSITSSSDAVNVAGQVTNDGTISGSGKTNLIGGSIQQIDGTGTISNLVVNNSFGVVVPATFSQTISSSLLLTAGSLTATGTIAIGNSASITRQNGSISGSVTYGTGITVNYTGTSSVTAGKELPTTATGLTINASGATYTLAAALPNLTYLTITAGTLSDGGFAITNSGNFSNSGTFNATSTVTLTGTGSISGSSTTTFDHLVVNPGTGNTVTLSRPIIISNALSLTSGTLNNTSNSLTVNASTFAISTNAITAIGSPILNFASTSGVAVGMSVSGTNLPSGATVIAVTSTTVTMSANVPTTAVASATSVTFTGGGVTRINGALTAQPIYVTKVHVSFTGNTANSGYELNPVTSTTIGNIVMNSSGKTYTLTNSITMSGTLTLTAGTIDDGGYEIVMTITGSNPSVSGTGVLTGNGRLRVVGAGSYCGFGAGVTIGTLYASNSSNIFTAGNLTITKDLILGAGTKSIQTQANSTNSIGGNIINLSTSTTTAILLQQFSNGKYSMAGTSTSSGIVGGTVSGSASYSGSITFTQSAGAGLSATATVVVNNGVLSSFIITDPGTGFTTAPTTTANGLTFTGIIAATSSGAKFIRSEYNNVQTGYFAIAANKTVNVVTNSATVPFTATQGAGTFTINSGATLNLGTSQFVLTSGGTLTNSSTGTIQTASTSASPIPSGLTIAGTVSYTGSASQTVAANTYTNLTLNNTYVTSPQLTLAGVSSVSGVLTLTSGKLDLGANNLTLSGTLSPSTPTSASYLVTSGAGIIKRTSVGNTATIFPIGSSGSSYTPLTITNTTGTSDLSVGVGTTFAAPVIDATKVLNLQWSVLGSVATTATVKYQFNSADGAGGSYTASNTDHLGNNTGVGAYSLTTVNPTGTPYTFTVTGKSIPATGATNYYVVGHKGAVESPTTTWAGTVSTDWTDYRNWDNGVPDTGDSVVIATTARQPILASSIGINSLNLHAGATLTINNNSTLSIPTAVINNGTITGGTLLLNGSSNQRISGTGLVGNLSLSNSTGATITSGSNSLGITGVLTLQSGNLATNGNVTLKSTSISNSGILAPYGASGNTGTISGNVTVERFMPKGFRAYRDISSGGVYSATNYLFNTWQESGSYANTGYGMFITGILDTLVRHNAVDATYGIDHSLTGNASAFYYRAGWDTVKNTKTELLNPYQSYRVLVRGDRSFDLDTSGVVMVTGPTQLAMNRATTLRATGSLITGTVTYTTSGVSNGVYTNNIGLNAASNGYTYVANPYAAPIDFHNIYTSGRLTNIDPRYYYLDPTMGSTGSYVSYNAVSNTSSNNATYGQFIQAGQGFLIGNTSSSPQLQITEADKSILSTSRTSVFGATTPNSKMAFTLLKQGAGATAKMDGAVAVFGTQFSNAMGIEDNVKMSNAADNLSILEGTKSLSIDGRLPATANDVLGINIGSLSGSNYQLEIDATAYTSNGLTAYLHDAYKNTTTALAAGINTISFTADAKVAATYQNRFSIIFKPSTLSLNSIVATATANGSVATITWNTVGEKGVAKFEVEKSTDGAGFTQIAEQSAKNTATAVYSETDKVVVSTATYYRIKAISTDGTITYSNIAKVTYNLQLTTYNLFPNPLTGKTLNVQLGNVVAGKYVVSITNALGQKVAEQAINHAGGNGSHKINMPSAIAAGVYNVSISSVESKQSVYRSQFSVQ